MEMFPSWLRVSTKPNNTGNYNDEKTEQSFSQTRNKTKLLALLFNVVLEIKANVIINNMFFKRI